MKAVGTKVVRGKDWRSGDEDGTNSSAITQVGTVITMLKDKKIKDKKNWVRVEWPNGYSSIYKMEAGWKYELQLAGA